MHGRAQCHRRQVGGAVAAGAHLPDRGEIGDATQMRHPTRADDRHADIVDQLVLDQVLAVPQRIEDFTDSQRRRRMLTDQLERLLILGRRGVFHPEQLVGLQRPAHLRGFQRRQAVMRVVQEVVVKAELFAQFFEQLRDIVQVFLRRPNGLGRQRAFGRFVEALVLGNAIGLFDAGHAGLGADRLIALVDIAGDLVKRVGDVVTVRVAIDHDLFARLAAQQIVKRHAGHLGLDVPQGDVDGSDGAHGHRSATPVGAAIEILPDIFDAAGVAADQHRDDVLFQIGDHRQFAAVQGAVADTVDALIGHDLERNEVAPRTGDDDLGAGNDGRHAFAADKGFGLGGMGFIHGWATLSGGPR